MAMIADHNSEVNVAELLARAGARACNRCGHQSSIPAHDNSGDLWFCFECGNEEREVSAAPALNPPE